MLKAVHVINAIPKGGNKDTLVPLNYRGRVFSGFINNRIVNYREMNDIYEEEQNEFRRKRLCDDHIFALTSIIENKLTEIKDKFCCKRHLTGETDICLCLSCENIKLSC